MEDFLFCSLGLSSSAVTVDSLHSIMYFKALHPIMMCFPGQAVGCIKINGDLSGL